ncbi:MAG TPA: hypothetical protein VLU95_06920 [Candidatus Acidoferrum sp.]|nr:hypothetical protein [Candidatus Acidoferrum sp.]
MQKTRISNSFAESTKIATLVICIVLMLSIFGTPLFAQLTPARDLSGTWRSTVSGTYYDMDPSDSSTRMNDITATFAMDITQQGSQITIILYLNPSKWVTDNAYWQTYGISGVPPVGGGSIEFAGTVSSSSFSADEQGSQLTQEHLAGTFTSDIITATLTGTSETTDQNGIVVTRTSSTTSAPTQNPASSPTTTGQPLASRFYGNIGSIKGSAYSKTANGNALLSSGQIPTGTEILTGDNGIIGFNPPNQGGTVYLGGNSVAGWVSLTSEPAPDSQISYLVYPPVSTGIIFPNGYSEFKDMLISMPIDATIAVAVFSEAILPAAAVALVVEGGAFLIPNGIAYVKETISHLIVVPQGALAGENTEYTVNVSSSETVVQVIDGPVVFIDPITNNTVTVQTNQVLSLPTGQQGGFTKQDLQNDVSTFNPSSLNQWWTQTTNDSLLNGVTNEPMILAIIIVVIVVAIVAAISTVAKRRKKELKQPPMPNPNSVSST